MEPVRLKLENFTSYKDEVIDFSGIHCAAIVGRNGHGKSSIFDGMLVALFGQGPNGGVRELANYISTNGEADGFRIEFDFRLQGVMYRVVRAYNEARGRHILEFFVKNGEDWNVLSEKSVRETQALIEEKLRMNYETFTASALSLQGCSDVFTGDMTDADRKKILAKILDLEIWDQMGKVTGEKIRDLERMKDERVRRKNGMSADLSEIVSRLEGTETLETDLLKAREDMSERETLLAELNEKLSQRAEIESNLKIFRSQFESKKEALEREKKNLASLVAAEDKLRKRLERAQNILEEEEEINEAVSRVNSLKRAIREEEARNQKYMEAIKLFGEAREAISRWQSNINAKLSSLASSIEGAKRQVAVLRGVPCGETLQKACPLLKMAVKAKEELEEMESKRESLASSAPPEQMTEALRDAQALVEKFKYDPEVLSSLRRELADVEKLALKAQLLESSREEYESVAEELEQLGWKIDESREEIERLAGEMQEIVDIGKAEKGKLAEFGDIEKRVESLKQEIKHLVSVIESMVRRAGEVSELKNQKTQLEKGLRDIETEILELEREIETRRLFKTACGQKGGVPALILENAVPEIERMANRFLDTIGGGEMQVSLKTQVEGKSSGSSQEVLRIMVLQNGEERVYKTFSGAERFLVDIALRAALSKFLAHRARADIQTFVLDEGLGTCEPEKQQSVIDGIISLSTDFSKVFVITHIPSLQDAMPQRIEVKKTDEGSKVFI